MPNENSQGKIIAKGSHLTVIWPWRLILFSFLIFAATLVIYVALALGYRPYLKHQVELKDTEIAQLAQTVPKEEQERFLTFYSQLVNLKSLLKNRIISAPLLGWLEEHTNSQVFFTSFNLLTKNREMVLEGVADSYDVLAEQIEVFRKASELERYSIQQSLKTPDHRVRFRVNLIFKPDFLRSDKKI